VDERRRLARAEEALVKKPAARCSSAGLKTIRLPAFFLTQLRELESLIAAVCLEVPFSLNSWRDDSETTEGAP
jgi:hypothetical protein